MVLQFDIYVGEEEETEKEKERRDSQQEEERYLKDAFQRSLPLSLCVRHKIGNASIKSHVLSEIITYLKETLSYKAVIAIPLYYLYTSQSVKPKSLKILILNSFFI
jgi:hypothetical protein